MNAQLDSRRNFIQENGGSDSDTDLDDSPEYYQAISSTPDDDDDVPISDEPPIPDQNGVENGYATTLDLSDGEEEEERMRNSAIGRAFREDERRRNAPLPVENAMRVMEAMRGVSFGGVAPDWTTQVPEDQWIEHLRSLRRPIEFP